MSLPALATADRFVDLAGLLESCEVGGFRADFVSWGHYRPEYWRNYSHTHSFHEVCLAYSGEGRFNCGPAEYDVAAGDVFLARPGDVHEIESSRAAPLGIAFWGFTFRPVVGVAGTGWWSGLTRSDGPVLSRELGGLPGVVAALAGEAAEPRSGYGEAVSALGAALVLDTARAFALPSDLSVEPVARDRGPVVVEAMQRHLLDNLARPVTVREVAAAVHLSERHAERLFRQAVGASMMATLRWLRLELAAQLLLEPSRSITQIAHACGYSDVRPFSTAFKRHYGRTPGEFRRTGGTSFG
ncbi:AraC family transcriptional regulator [Kribbella sp. NPDC056861]|uniref:AraC family transcriptional regulator n=1 Tax=Kribbella sp. NPDC056861 TaxID=3154857 RepID=UPI0034284A32